MPPRRIHGLESERNRNKRRDKKAQKKRTGMRVDDSARKLAEIKRRSVKLGDGKTVGEWEDMINNDPNIQHGPRRDYAPNWVADPRYPA